MSDKKQIIYKEVLAMLNAGADYQAITLSEVANRCGMGKSTLYGYFVSKDEMIFNSILYYINRMLKFFSQGFKITTFDESIKTYLKALIVTMGANFWIVLPWTFDSYLKYLSRQDAATLEKLLYKTQKIMLALLSSICAQGQEEGEIGEYEENNIRFAYFAIVGELSCKLGDDFDVNSSEGKQFLIELINNLKRHLY